MVAVPAARLTSASMPVMRAVSPLIVKRAGLSVDRKSTRLNSSHLVISYAVFCLKKKTEEHTSELQSQSNLVCRILLEKNINIYEYIYSSYHTNLMCF